MKIWLIHLKFGFNVHGCQPNHGHLCTKFRALTIAIALSGTVVDRNRSKILSLKGLSIAL